jgi:hypothetical protein
VEASRFEETISREFKTGIHCVGLDDGPVTEATAAAAILIRGCEGIIV